jgi:hypothetical protein
VAVPVVQTGWTTDATTAGGSSISLGEPTGLATDDLCIIIVANDDTTNTDQWDNTTNKPTGFTLINESGAGGQTDAHCAAFYRVIDGTESWPISVPAQSTDDYLGWAFRVTGASTTAPINVTGADWNSGGTSSTHAPTVSGDTDVDDCLCFCILGFDGGDGDPFSVSGTGWSIW